MAHTRDIKPPPGFQHIRLIGNSDMSGRITIGYCRSGQDPVVEDIPGELLAAILEDHVRALAALHKNPVGLDGPDEVCNYLGNVFLGKPVDWNR